MKIVFTVMLALTALLAQAREVSLNGVKPAAIIDVRTPEEYAAGHVEGAVNIPYEQIASGIKTVKGLKKDQPVLVYCRSGRRSAIAKKMLEKDGFKRILDGGGISELTRNLKVCDKRC